MIGKIHMRQTGLSCRDIRIPAARAAIPGARKTTADCPSGGITALLMMNGMAEIATSIITTPPTVCVNIRRREARRRVKTDWTRVETTTKLASKPGPPTWSARALTARNGTLKFATMRRPEPKYRSLRDCRTILAPVTASAVNVTHDR